MGEENCDYCCKSFNAMVERGCDCYDKHPDITDEQDLAFRVIGVLNGRKGFDSWWCEIDDDVQDEIIQEVAACFVRGQPDE